MICPMCSGNLIYLHTHILDADYTVSYKLKFNGKGFETWILGGKRRVKMRHNYDESIDENSHTEKWMRLDGVVHLDAERIERLLVLR